MELILDKTPVFLTETVFDGQTEQGIELDYVLPDYYPDIFKILKCSLTPRIVSYSVSGSQLYIDGVAYIKILYLSEGGESINCIDQRYTYSKTLELASPVQSPKVCLFPKTDYCSCRAVSGRRIDVRGAVSCRVKVTGCTESRLLCGVSGMGTQVRSSPVSCCESTLYADRQFVTREDIETGAGGGIAAVLSVSASLSPAETKVIADKAVIKSEAKVKALYLIRNSDGRTGTEVMEAAVPLSQIIDIEGITDKHSCFAELDIMDCDLEIKQGDDGENRTFGCDITIDCRVSAYKEGQISPVCDLYSTDYESSYTVTPIRTENSPQLISAQTNIRSQLGDPDGDIGEVFDCRCDITALSARSSEDGRLIVNGQVCLQMIERNSAGSPAVIEKTESFEARPDIPPVGDSFSYTPTAQVTGVSYSISGDGKAEVRAAVSVGGLLCRVSTVNAVSEITINEDKPCSKDRDYALKLYFAEAGESVWDIAKRYNTSIKEVVAENELEQEKLSSPSMLLIPVL